MDKVYFRHAPRTIRVFSGSTIPMLECRCSFRWAIDYFGLRLSVKEEKEIAMEEKRRREKVKQCKQEQERKISGKKRVFFNISLPLVQGL